MIKAQINLNKLKTALEKIQRLSQEKDLLTIVTHDGKFHADEVFSLAMLVEAGLLPNYNLIRTRDLEIINNADIVLDVGNIYDPVDLKFDHHQVDEKLPKYVICPKSFDYGHSFEESIMVTMATCGMIANMVAPILWPNEKVAKAMVDWLVQVDLTDNGEGKVLGETHATSMCSVIGLYNMDDVYSPLQDNAFYEAVELARGLICKKAQAFLTKIAAAEEVLAAVEHLENPGILELKSGIPWVETVQEKSWLFNNVKVCVYPVTENDWRIQSLPGSNKFDMKCPAPEEWRGKRDEELIRLTNISNVKFVHHVGFIGGATTRHAAVELAKKWIKA